MSNIQFTIFFKDKNDVPINQYTKTDILSLTDFQAVETAASRAYPNRLVFTNDGLTNASPTISASAEAQYIDDVIALIDNTAIPNPTTQGGTLNGQSITTPIEFTIVLPNGQSMQNVILSASDYISLQNNVAPFTILNEMPTSNSPTETYAQLAAFIQKGSSTSPTTGQITQTFILAKFTINSKTSAGIYNCTLVYQDGHVVTYDLSTTNVQYWLKNSAQITDNTGDFVGVSTPNPGTIPNTTGPTGTSTTPTSSTSVDQANAQITALNTQIAQLQAQLGSSTSDQATLQQEIALLTQELDALKTSSQQDTAQYANTQAALQEANNKLASLQANDQTLQNNLAAAIASLTTATNTINMLQQKVNQATNVGNAKIFPIVATIAGIGAIGVGIWFLDPKKKTVGEIVTKKIEKAVEPVTKPIKEAVKDLTKYCKGCHRKHKSDHKHFMEKPKDEIKTEEIKPSVTV